MEEEFDEINALKDLLDDAIFPTDTNNEDADQIDDAVWDPSVLNGTQGRDFDYTDIFMGNGTSSLLGGDAFLDADHTEFDVGMNGVTVKPESESDEEMDDAENEDVVDFWAKAATNQVSLKNAFKSAPKDPSLKDFDNDNDVDFDADADTEGAEDTEVSKHQRELDDLIRRKPRSQKEKTRRRRRDYLTPEAKNWMSMANTSFLNGDYEEARKTLLKIIHVCPRAPDAYKMLGTIHEDMGDVENAVLFFMVAAHLRASDVALWKRIASLALDLNQLDQAVYCLSKALKANPDDIDATMDRVAIWVEQGKLKRAKDAFSSVLKKRKLDLTLAQELANLCLELKEKEKALKVFEECMARVAGYLGIHLGPELGSAATAIQNHEEFPDEVDTEVELSFHHINMLAELYLINKRYQKAMVLIEQSRCLLAPGETQMPLDLEVKLGICQVHTSQDFGTAFDRLKAMTSWSSVLDLAKDVAEAFYTNNKQAEALVFYERLVKHTRRTDIKTWLCLAECLKNANRFKDAIKYYERVLEVHPTQSQVKISVADCYEAIGDMHMASHIREELRPGKNVQSMESLLTHAGRDRIQGPRKPGRKKKVYDKEMESMIAIQEADNATAFRHCMELYEDHDQWADRAHLAKLLSYARKLVVVFQSTEVFFQRLHDKKLPGSFKKQKAGKRASKKDSSDDSDFEEFIQMAPSYMGLEVSEWEKVNLVYTEALMHLAEMMKNDREVVFVHGETNLKNGYTTEIKACYERASKALEQLILSNISKVDRRRRFRARLYWLAVAFAMKHGENMYGICRTFIDRFSRYADPFAFCSMVCGSSIDTGAEFSEAKLQKYFTRMINKNPNDPHLMMIHGQIFQSNRSFPLSIVRFMEVIKLLPESPLAWLCLAVSFLDRAMQRRTENRHLQIIQGIAAMKKYEKFRCDAWQSPWATQETLYNVGRSYMMLGLHHLAVPVFEKALEVVNMADMDQEEVETYDLSRDIAYCLSVIYTETGAMTLARQVLMKHCII